MAVGQICNISSSSERELVCDTQTRPMYGPAALNISSTRLGSTERGESEKRTTPIASAPSLSAVRASSGLVIPQIFTRIQIPPVFFVDSLLP